MFLKTINEFNYDHSENLGNAYEYLLSVLGTQGDAGQFRTPRHIIEFIVSCVDPQKHESILDPACGTAGFILSSYKHILRNNAKTHDGDKLTPDERKRIAENLIGFDIDPNMVRFSLVNMFLHKFQTPHIYEYDTLSSEDRWNEYYDVIVANPPFMTPKGGIKPHKRFSIQATKSEVLFTDYMAEHLAPNGRAGIIVPNGIIATTQTAYKSLRKMLIENYLVAVVSLPAGVFNPYSGVKTSILLLDKKLSKKTDNLLFIKVENDGYDLGAQRREFDKNDLPEALRIFNDYKTSILTNTEFTADEKGIATLVRKEKILENKDVNLSVDRYGVRKLKSKNTFPLITLADICEKITDGTHQTPIYADKGIVFLSSKNVTSKKIDWEHVKYISEELHNNLQKRVSPKLNDILLAKNGTTGVAAIVDKDIVFDIYVSLALLRPSDKIFPKYLLNIINSEKVKEQFNSRISSLGVPNLHLVEIKEVLIPLPPLEIQQQIVAEIEGYQKDIEGMKIQIQEKEQKIKDRIADVWGEKE